MVDLTVPVFYDGIIVFPFLVKHNLIVWLKFVTLNKILLCIHSQRFKNWLKCLKTYIIYVFLFLFSYMFTQKISNCVNLLKIKNVFQMFKKFFCVSFIHTPSSLTIFNNIKKNVTVYVGLKSFKSYNE